MYSTVGAAHLSPDKTVVTVSTNLVVTNAIRIQVLLVEWRCTLCPRWWIEPCAIRTTACVCACACAHAFACYV